MCAWICLCVFYVVLNCIHPMCHLQQQYKYWFRSCRTINDIRRILDEFVFLMVLCLVCLFLFCCFFKGCLTEESFNMRVENIPKVVANGRSNNQIAIQEHFHTQLWLCICNDCFSADYSYFMQISDHHSDHHFDIFCACKSNFLKCGSPLGYLLVLHIEFCGKWFNFISLGSWLCLLYSFWLFVIIKYFVCWIS